MPTIPKLSERFEELEHQMAAVEATKKFVRTDYFEGNRIDDEIYLGWRLKARNLLVMACGEKSEHYKQFLEIEKPQSYQTNYEQFKLLAAVFRASREDYDGGYITSIRSLVQADLFDIELDQARQLLSSGYSTAAAVIAGVVLETTLRQLCQDNSIEISKLDKMNADLAKAGIYNSLIQKRITALASIRNSAAHGKADDFTKADVDEMISYIEKFVGERV